MILTISSGRERTDFIVLVQQGPPGLELELHNGTLGSHLSSSSICDEVVKSHTHRRGDQVVVVRFPNIRSRLRIILGGHAQIHVLEV